MKNWKKNLFVISTLILATSLGPLFANAGGRSTGTGNIGSSNIPDPYAPVDGVMNVTGALSASTYVVGGGKVTSGDSAINSGSSIYSNVDANDLMITAVTDNGSTAVALTLAAYDDFTMAGAKIISGGDKAGTTYVEKFAFMLDGAALFTPTALALSGAHTALPVGGIVEVTATGAQTWTITETGATAGETHIICNVGADAVTMDHVAGQVLLTGGADVVLGQNDCLQIYYSSASSAWRQHGATANN